MDGSTPAFAREFFTAQQWDNLVEIEKKRYINIYENYQKMKELGLDPKLPVFEFTSNKGSTEDCSGSSTEEEDEEWRPSKRSKKKKSSSPVRSTSDIKTALKSWMKFQPRRRRLSVSSDDEESPHSLGPLNPNQSSVCYLWNCITLEPASKFKVKVGKFTPSSVKPASAALTQRSPRQSPKAEQRRYPKRSCSRKSYVEEDSLNDDDFIFCDDCNEDCEGGCPLHPLLLVLNKEVPRDGSVENRGKVSAPWPLFITPSKVKEAGLGVRTEADLPRGLLFGPYEGRVLNHVPQGEESGYGWRIRDKANPGKCVDAVDSSVSNWLRFVNCSRTYDETNLAAFQFKGQIYYKTVTEINRGAELMVWYGDEYGEELGYRLDDQKEDSSSRAEVAETSGRKFASDNSLLRKHNTTRLENTSCRQHDQNHKPAFALLQGIDKNNNNNTTNCFINDLKVFPVKCLHEKAFNTFREWHLESSKFADNGEKSSFNTKNYAFKHKDLEVTPQPRMMCLEGDQRASYFSKTSRTENGVDHCLIRENVPDDLCRTGKKLYKCFQCHKTFTQLSSLKDHLRIHSGEMPFKCSQCDGAFTRLSHLKSHLRIHSGERPYKCSQCEKAFTQSSDLKKHLLIHSGERPYKCSQCEKAFNRLGSLKRHLRIHSGERPYKCSQCEKAFTQSGDLKKHLLIHSGERPYKCSQCEKAFNRLGSLKRHLRIHSGERPYKCSQCEKAFTQLSNLKYHLQIHSGERHYKCSQCDKAFTQPSVLKKHLLIHSGETPYKCSQCKKSI